MCGAETGTEEGGYARLRDGWRSAGYPEPKDGNEAGEGRPWEGRQPIWVSKEHPVTGGVGLSVSKAMEVALTPGSQGGPELYAYPVTHWAPGARHSPPRPLPSGLAHVQNKCLHWDLMPELPSGTLSFPPSLSRGSLHSRRNLMSMDQVTLYDTRGPDGQEPLSSFYD